MNKEQFDNVIKKNLAEVYGKDAFGYVLSKTYWNYYTKKEFDQFKIEMQSPKYIQHYEKYSEGKGNELLEKVGRYGTLPPKMASVASSSRFCYLALRDGGTGLSGSGQVQFEHECRIKGITGTAPQLDAYIPNENIYVEAKCHEIFDLHKIKMSIKYWEYIFGNDNDFGLPALKKPDIDTFEIPVSIFGVDKENTMFDTKQFLCHLLGIASQKQHSEEAKLVYLFFKPKSRVEEIASEVDEIFSELKQEMTSIFNCAYIKKFITKHNIKLTAIAEYAEIMGPLIDQNALILISV